LQLWVEHAVHELYRARPRRGHGIRAEAGEHRLVGRGPEHAFLQHVHVEVDDKGKIVLHFDSYSGWMPISFTIPPHFAVSARIACATASGVSAPSVKKPRPRRRCT